MPSSTDSWGYSSLGNQAQQPLSGAGESFPLQPQARFRDDVQDGDALANDRNDYSPSLYSENNNSDFRINFNNNKHNDVDPLDTDDEDEDDDNEGQDLDDYAPLAAGSTKRSYKDTTNNRQKTPCRILATVFGSAVIVALAFALLSMLHLNNNKSLDPPPEPTPTNNTTAPARLLNPPTGINIDQFTLDDFKLPPWDWDINTFLPIDITNGPKFTKIAWRNGEQYLSVDCPQPYRYHFRSFAKDEFREHASISYSIDDLLHLGQEPYVFVMCPPGMDNANVVFREFDMPDDPDVTHPPHVPGTAEAPQPLVEDVVMLLVDAISRAKFLVAMKTVMEVIQKVNTTGGHRIFDFEHYNVLGQNSPPNKAFIYSGQSVENMKQGPKHWLWHVYEEQGFSTAHTDGECGGEEGVHDYVMGAITYEYAHIYSKEPAQYQMNQVGWCQNHDMHMESKIWGQSCTLPPSVRYDDDLMGGMRYNTPYCAGEKAIHEHIMENMEGWLASHKGHKRFVTWSFMDAHSPDHHHISFDRKLAKFIQDLLIGSDGAAPLLNPNSVLVIMADHGLHYGRETYTFPGFIHHKIPPLFVALPKPLLEQRPDFTAALESNQNRVLSHLDLHQTFLHLAYGDQPAPAGEQYTEYMTRFIADGTFRRQFHANAPNQTSFAQTYGRSLLLPIEANRSCSSGGIPHDFCAFQPFLALDPSKAQDATFLRQALLLVAKRMNELAVAHKVNDICLPSSLVLDPPEETGASPTGSYDVIGTADLVMESAYASGSPSIKQALYGEKNRGRVFYFMVRDRSAAQRKYSITMQEDDMVMGVTSTMTIQQMSAYASSWRPCAERITKAGNAIGKWQEVVKHFCVCSK
ncbi:hypothetical protein BGZ94_005454 [Podila epigama]|nr:hypothetical protein BGZ94_005454 [Podila epigama]